MNSAPQFQEPFNRFPFHVLKPIAPQIKLEVALSRLGIVRHCSICKHEPGMHKCCPQCTNSANSEEEIEEIFGFRTMTQPTGKHQIPQTWCRCCRRDSLLKSSKAKI